MAVPSSLRRLQGLRAAEEQQKSSALASAIQELHRLERALTRARDRALLGRKIVNAGLESGKTDDRIVGLEEIAAADRVARVLAARIRTAGNHLAAIREEFLAARVQRRQAESLLESAFAQDTVDRKRKAQMALDDWHRSRHNSDSTDHPGRKVESGKSGDTAEHGRT